jgi:urocanate hydratase
VTVIADGSREAEERLNLALTNDTSLGVMRYADAGYEEALGEVRNKGLRHFRLS